MNSEEARELADHFGLRLPDELIQWLGQWDDESGDVIETALSTSTGGVALLYADVSLEGMLWQNLRLRAAGARYALHPAHPPASWPHDWIAFADDAEGNYYAVNCGVEGPRGIVFVSHDPECIEFINSLAALQDPPDAETIMRVLLAPAGAATDDADDDDADDDDADDDDADDEADDPYSGFWVTRGAGPWRPGPTPITESEWAASLPAAGLSPWVVRGRNPFTGEVSEVPQADKAIVGKLPAFGPPQAPPVTHYNGTIVFEGPTSARARSAALRLAKFLQARVFDEAGDLVE